MIVNSVYDEIQAVLPLAFSQFFRYTHVSFVGNDITYTYQLWFEFTILWKTRCASARAHFLDFLDLLTHCFFGNEFQNTYRLWWGILSMMKRRAVLPPAPIFSILLICSHVSYFANEIKHISGSHENEFYPWWKTLCASVRTHVLDPLDLLMYRIFEKRFNTYQFVLSILISINYGL